jgi:pimeloyl-ACP methyl ester carboxylesterase
MMLVTWFVAVYAVICAAAYFGNRRLMYFPDPKRISPAEAGLDGIQEIEIAAADGVILVACYVPAKGDRPTLLYFHGNAANAANRAPKMETISEDGCGVFYLNNRRYGGSGGRPTEEANVADVITAYDYLIRLGVSAERIFAYGESLGSGQDVRLATKRSVPRLCSKRRSPRPLMWPEHSIFGCRLDHGAWERTLAF